MRTSPPAPPVSRNGLLYQDQLEPVAELDGTGRVVAVFV